MEGRNILVIEDDPQHKLLLEKFIKTRLINSLHKIEGYIDFRFKELIWKTNKRDALKIKKTIRGFSQSIFNSPARQIPRKKLGAGYI